MFEELEVDLQIQHRLLDREYEQALRNPNDYNPYCQKYASANIGYELENLEQYLETINVSC